MIWGNGVSFGPTTFKFARIKAEPSLKSLELCGKLFKRGRYSGDRKTEMGKGSRDLSIVGGLTLKFFLIGNMYCSKLSSSKV